MYCGNINIWKCLCIGRFLRFVLHSLGMWYRIICPFEGPSAEGRQFQMYVEWDEDVDEIELWDHFLEHKEKIRAFKEHSIDTELMQEVGDVSENAIKAFVSDFLKPDFALFRDGRVYEMQYANECRWVK